jgi:hypothetical protein
MSTLITSTVQDSRDRLDESAQSTNEPNHVDLSCPGMIVGFFGTGLGSAAESLWSSIEIRFAIFWQRPSTSNCSQRLLSRRFPPKSCRGMFQSASALDCSLAALIPPILRPD